MDLFDASAVRSYGGNRYTLVTVDDYSRKVKESLKVIFDENPPPSNTSPLVDDDLDEDKAIKISKKKNLKNDIVDETLEIDKIVNIKESRNHPLENVMGNLNQRTLRKVKESLKVTFDETPPPSNTSPLVDDDLDEDKAIKISKKKNLKNDIVDETLEIDKIVNIKESRNHPLENVMGNLNQRTLRSQAHDQ
nr:retrotransposon protein [Tanacetum cinerariifolium]